MRIRTRGQRRTGRVWRTQADGVRTRSPSVTESGLGLKDLAPFDEERGHAVPIVSVRFDPISVFQSCRRTRPF